MFKKNSIKILLAISLALSTFYSNANAMKNNKNSKNVNNITELNTINESSKDKNKEDKKNKESNINLNLKKSQSAPNLENYNIKIDEPKNKNKKLNKMPKFTFDINKINKKPEFKLNENNDFINKIVEKKLKKKDEEKLKKEKDMLINLHSCLKNLIKKFDEKLTIIAKTSSRYKNLKNSVEKQMESLEDIADFPRRPMYRQAIEEADKLHQQYDFDIYSVTSDLLTDIEKMENLIIELEEKYNEYFNFIKNIKYKETLDFYYNTYDYDSLNAIIFNRDVNSLKNKKQEILDSLEFPTQQEIDIILQKNDREKTNNDTADIKKYIRKLDYINFIYDFEYEKIFEQISITEKLKKEIEIRKKIIPYIHKIVKADVLENMEKKILDLVDEEHKIRKAHNLNKDQLMH